MKPKPKRTGPPTGHPGWGGRPKGATLPCGACGARLAASEWRKHFTACPSRVAVAVGRQMLS